ncbi:endo alpha-1,4 polygalactosaminidase [Chitinophaga nivalis]|uniref:Endo alpha-1,4 polygalactosaminidase n=1 Tax=Chitinophaga nivalis TaxID=2991709 RepID=A0ABT3IGX7_9BACT|nr:endo alpha-1,4 polygalactosaminidase [Chitinophaga nivalis]MCW3467086.1 endo alpha-1,4 polygalactosaminidase [Chitinophaga nivalis]MCW3483223.1 endo alpha-1,4 polygalactosaminidase [Chitinophaga nivalis]
MKTMRSQLLFAYLMYGTLTSCTSKENVTLSLKDSTTQANRQQAAVVDYRQEMRNFVIGISQYAKSRQPQFAIIPQNGHDLVTTDGEPNGPLATSYLQAIDGVGREDLLFGYDNDNVATPAAETQTMQAFLNRIKTTKKVLITDYCSGKTNMDKSYRTNNGNGYISFAADQRELNHIPAYPATPYGVNNSDITQIMQAKNFLYIINPESATKAKFLNDIAATNYDLIIMDLYFDSATIFTAADIDRLKRKANGGKRLVVSYMSIGEAESYRYYWGATWKPGNPPFIREKDPNWKGNYYAAYWNLDWQHIIYGNDTSYLKKILDSHFDGAYLDLIDAFEYFEGKRQ